MTAEVDAERPRKRGLLKNHNFLIIWAAQFVSRFGDSLASMGFLFFILYRLNGSALAVGQLMLAASIPSLFLGPVAGVFVDRWPRRLVMIVSDVLRGALFLVAPFLTALWQIYVLVFVSTVISRFFAPARQAIMPDIVHQDDLLQANSLSETTYQFLGILAPALGAALVAAVGYRAAFVGNAISFFVSAAAILFVRARESGLRAGKTSFRDVVDGLKSGLVFIAKEPLVRYISGAAFFIMLGAGSINILFLPFFRDVLGWNIKQIGYAESVLALGAILGAMLAVVLGKYLSSRTIAFGSVAYTGVVLFLLGLNRSMVLAFVILLFVGLVNPLLSIPLVTALQKKVPAEIRGRVFSTFGSLAESSSILSMAAGPSVAELFGVRAVMMAVGVYEMVVGPISWFFARKLDFGDRRTPNAPAAASTAGAAAAGGGPGAPAGQGKAG
ncbi:MAG: MFS transporter [Bacillota bacterium]